MTEAVDLAEPPAKASKLPLIVSAFLALLLGGGAFAYFSGALAVSGDDSTIAEADVAPMPDVAFVPLDPLVINLGHGSQNRHLRFRAQIEVEPAHRAEVEHLMPRLLDVLNGYLRAIEIDEIEEPSALVRLRAQMLRRLQIVSGEGRIRDLLIMEFVLN